MQEEADPKENNFVSLRERHVEKKGTSMHSTLTYVFCSTLPDKSHTVLLIFSCQCSADQTIEEVRATTAAPPDTKTGEDYTPVKVLNNMTSCM